MSNISKAGVVSASGNREIVTLSQTLTGVGATDWVRFVNTQIVAQVSGVATAITAVVERSDINPAGPRDPGVTHVAPADTTGFTGDPATGVVPNVYIEPGVGWWRINVTALTGASVNLSLSGIGGDNA